MSAGPAARPCCGGRPAAGRRRPATTGGGRPRPSSSPSSTPIASPSRAGSTSCFRTSGIRRSPPSPPGWCRPLSRRRPAGWRPMRMWARRWISGPARPTYGPGARWPTCRRRRSSCGGRALEALGGFDESLTVGEDVDLVWRLVAAGWTVRYEPGATVRHPMRADRPGLAGPALPLRHLGRRPRPPPRRRASSPAVVSPWTAAAWGLVAAGDAAGRRRRRRRLHRRSGRREAPTAPGAGAARPAPVRLPVREAVRLAGLGSSGADGRWRRPCAGPGRRRPSSSPWSAAGAGRRWPRRSSSRRSSSGSPAGPGSIPSGSSACAWPTTSPTPPASGPAVPGSIRSGRSSRPSAPPMPRRATLASRRAPACARLAGQRPRPHRSEVDHEDQGRRAVLPAGKVGGHRGRPRRAQGQRGARQDGGRRAVPLRRPLRAPATCRP